VVGNQSIDWLASDTYGVGNHHMEDPVCDHKWLGRTLEGIYGSGKESSNGSGFANQTQDQPSFGYFG
jgi:hypothetical protein